MQQAYIINHKSINIKLTSVISYLKLNKGSSILLGFSCDFQFYYYGKISRQII